MLKDIIQHNMGNNTHNNKSRYLISLYLKTYDITLSNNEYYQLLYYKNINDRDFLEKYITKRYISNELKQQICTTLQSMYITQSYIIPKIIHIIYINVRPLRLYNYICIFSILQHMNDYEMYIHNDKEPNDEHWIKLKTYKNVKIIKINRSLKYNDMSINHVQYEADILRMEILLKHGGIYMDTDIFILRNFEKIITDQHSLYICKENVNNIINCVIISTPNNPFLKIWFDYFDMGLKMNNWGWHIRDLPKKILERNIHYTYKYDIKIMNHKTFCPIEWTESEKLLNIYSFMEDEDVYGIHLFDTILGDKLLNIFDDFILP